MKDSDKKKIEELWLRGYGCTKIAAELGINVNFVKSYCRRHGLTKDRPQEKIHKINTDVNEPRCKCCGVLLPRRVEQRKNLLFRWVQNKMVKQLSRTCEQMS